MKILFLLALSSMMFIASTSMSVAASGDAQKGQASYAVCASCHGQEGQGYKRTGGPALAGQQAWYLTRQINNFKQGIRGAHEQDTFGKQMAPMAMMLATDQAIADVIAYIETLPSPKLKKPKGNAAAGKATYGMCSACHGADGSGNQAMNAPKISGLQEWYIARQLKNFKAGIRGAHPQDTYGMQMAPMASMLATDQMIDDLSAYISSL